MYDFEMTLLVSQQSHKDPREYIPFLMELQKLPLFYQRFKIDDYLKRYKKAMTNLCQAGTLSLLNDNNFYYYICHFTIVLMRNDTL
jgi:hypothetical protein